MKFKENRFEILCILAIVVCATLIYGLFKLYPGEIVQVYGDKRIEGAKVYINDQPLGIMTWDEEYSRTYARDIRLLGQPSTNKNLDDLEIKSDSMKVRNRGGDVTIKIITGDNKVYTKEYKNIEDIGYFNHELKDFDLLGQQ